MRLWLIRRSVDEQRSCRGKRARWIAILVWAVPLLAGGMAGEAAAASGSQPASAQLSLHAAPDVLSVTVSPSSATFDACRGGDSTSPGQLGFPNGTCHVNGLVITNTGLPGHMMVSGAPMSPTGGGTPWVLCGATDRTTPSCNNVGQPGADQYNLALTNNIGRFGLGLSAQAQCDITFGGLAPSCAAAPGQSTFENVRLTGPQSTSSGANSYTTTITWTVAP
jgi:hypothetical protein